MPSTFFGNRSDPILPAHVHFILAKTQHRRQQTETHVGSDQVDLGVSVLAGLGGRHVNDLAGTALDQDVARLAESGTLDADCQLLLILMRAAFQALLSSHFPTVLSLLRAEITPANLHLRPEQLIKGAEDRLTGR